MKMLLKLKKEEVNVYYVQGIKQEPLRIQDFKIEGAQKMSSAHHEHKARNSFNLGGVHVGSA